jgi:Fe-S-cluster containining protein
MHKSPKENSFYAKGLRFSCKHCSSCCRYESGYVFLSEKDASLLVDALDIKFTEFSRTFCRWVPGVNGKRKLSLREKSNMDCIFWSSEKGGCSVYEARPLQCKAFPFWASILCDEETWKSTSKNCPGIDNGTLHSSESIENWLLLQNNAPAAERTRGAP